MKTTQKTTQADVTRAQATKAATPAVQISKKSPMTTGLRAGYKGNRR